MPLMLLLLALMGLALAAAGPLWAQAEQRERERELLRVGLLYAQALSAYRQASPGSLKQLPQELHELVLDARFVATQRHLRRLYADPLNPQRPWGLLRDGQGRIRGVYSQDERPPIAQGSLQLPVAQGSLQLPDRQLTAVRRYADWHFVALDTP